MQWLLLKLVFGADFQRMSTKKVSFQMINALGPVIKLFLARAGSERRNESAEMALLSEGRNWYEGDGSSSPVWCPIIKYW